MWAQSAQPLRPREPEELQAPVRSLRAAPAAALSLVLPWREQARAAGEASLAPSWRKQAQAQALAAEAASPARRLRRAPDSAPPAEALARGAADLALAPLARAKAAGPALARRSPAPPAPAPLRRAEQTASGPALTRNRKAGQRRPARRAPAIANAGWRARSLRPREERRSASAPLAPSLLRRAVVRENW
jgi:hypothetical protein